MPMIFSLILTVLVTVNLILTLIAGYLQTKGRDRLLLFARAMALMVMASIVTMLVMKMCGI